MENLGATIAALLPRVSGNPTAMLRVARLMQKDGQCERAVTLCRGALALAPHDAALHAQANLLLTNTVPGWHFSIVRDVIRNAAYDSALRRAVKPGVVVLEIGTGTGLLALMAARAGAAQVITCEMNPLIAETARSIIAQNGYADRIRVIAKHSDLLELDADLGGRADILVSEIVSNNLLGEDVLPAHERVMRDLMKRDARVIPARGHVRVALAEDICYEASHLSVMDGFDLSAMNTLLGRTRQIRVGHDRLQLRSAVGDAFQFDFASPTFCRPSRSATELTAYGGRVNGIAQWLLLDMDEAERYENQPAKGATSCWGVVMHYLPYPIDTSPGQKVCIGASHDRHSLIMWLEENSL